MPATLTRESSSLNAIPEMYRSIVSRELIRVVGELAGQGCDGDRLIERAISVADAMSAGLNRINAGPESGNTPPASDESQ